VQNSADIAFNFGGADSTIGAVGMHQFVDNCGINQPMIRLGLDASYVSGLYLTPTKAGCAIRVDRGSGTIFTANNFDSASQNGLAAMCKGALIQLRGGTTVWNGTRLFGCMTDPASADGGAAQNKGYVTVTGGRHVFNGAMFENGVTRGNSGDFTPAGTPHVYATSNAVAVAVAGLLAANPLVLKQQVAGKIITNLDPFVSVG
jgi:hypothetical protein